MKIVVMDDERPALEMLVDTLTKLCPEDEIVPFQRLDEILRYGDKSDIDVAFLDIEIGRMNGIELAVELKRYSPKCNIIFVTSYSKYGSESFKARPSGYVTKPFTEEDIQRELDNLRFPVDKGTAVERTVEPSAVVDDGAKKLRCVTFGNFVVYNKDGDVVTFSKTKSKELLAYLIDCAGFPVTTKEIAKDIYEVDLDKQMSKNISKVIISLMDDLKKAGYEGAVIKQNRQLYINKDHISCDIYDALDGDVNAINSYHGEYLIEYSWAELSDSIGRLKKL